jgi:hypothetical protein
MKIMNENLATKQNIDMSILGMLSIQERQYLYEYTKTEYSGRGAIVDLGCWLGSSTIPMAMGLVENTNPQIENKQIHAYDLFIWEDWMDDCVSHTNLQGKFKPGDSFLNAYQQQTLPWEKQICSHPGDLTQLGWQGGEIEFLFVDAMKSWELANSIIHDFFPSLVPGQSTIVHQDFSHYYTYWIHLIMYRFREYFEVDYDVSYSASLAFKYKKQIPDEDIKKTYSIECFEADEINAAFNYSASLVAPEKSSIILLAKLRATIDFGADLHKDSIIAALSTLEGEFLTMQYLRSQGVVKSFTQFSKPQQLQKAYAYFIKKIQSKF